VFPVLDMVPPVPAIVAGIPARPALSWLVAFPVPTGNVSPALLQRSAPKASVIVT